jgi:hypothetical protein
MLHVFLLPIGSMDADSPKFPHPVHPLRTRQRGVVRSSDSGWLRQFFLKRATRRHKMASRKDLGNGWGVYQNQGRVELLVSGRGKRGRTVGFRLRAHGDKATGKRYFEKSIDEKSAPQSIAVDRSGTNLAALSSTIAGRSNAQLNPWWASTTFVAPAFSWHRGDARDQQKTDQDRGRSLTVRRCAVSLHGYMRNPSKIALLCHSFLLRHNHRKLLKCLLAIRNASLKGRSADRCASGE